MDKTKTGTAEELRLTGRPLNQIHYTNILYIVTPAIIIYKSRGLLVVICLFVDRVFSPLPVALWFCRLAKRCDPHVFLHDAKSALVSSDWPENRAHIQAIKQLN